MATIVVTGRLGKDAELRETQNNTKVLQFSLADDVGYGDKKKTQWLKCLLWGKRAESLAEHLTKGSIVEVTGTPSIETWLKKGDGSAQGAIVVNVSEVRLHGGNKREEPAAPKSRAPAPKHDDEDSDIPF